MRKTVFVVTLLSLAIGLSSCSPSHYLRTNQTLKNNFGIVVMGLKDNNGSFFGNEFDITLENSKKYWPLYGSQKYYYVPAGRYLIYKIQIGTRYLTGFHNKGGQLYERFGHEFLVKANEVNYWGTINIKSTMKALQDIEVSDNYDAEMKEFDEEHPQFSNYKKNKSLAKKVK